MVRLVPVSFAVLLALPVRAGPDTPPPEPRAEPRTGFSVSRLGPFDLDAAPSVLAQLPELASCARALARPSGQADCVLGPNDENLARVQVAWEDMNKPGGEIIALRFQLDPATAPVLTELEWGLARAWGPPALEQLRRDRELKVFTIQWEDSEHRATLEAQGPANQPSRGSTIVLERKPRPMPPELQSLRPRPFPAMRTRLARRLDIDGQPWAVVWGTSLQPSQEVLGESGPAWNSQKSYVGIFRLEPVGARKRWRPAWERTSGEEEDDPQRVVKLELRDVTGDGQVDVVVELTCQTCGASASELLVKTIRAGRLVDLLAKRELLRAHVDFGPVGQLRIAEAEGDDAVTVSTYAYDRGKGAFVLAREERRSAPHGEK